MHFTCELLKGKREEKGTGQDAPDSQKGKRPDMIHTHTLGNEGTAPDDGCQQQIGSAFDFAFHMYHRV